MPRQRPRNEACNEGSETHQAARRAFFDHVTVDADNADLRLNRLRLLAEVRRVAMGVADFEKITDEGEGVA